MQDENLDKAVMVRMSHILLTFLVLLRYIGSASASAGNIVKIGCIERERQALLLFKQGLVDESGVLSSWGEKKECCKWRGVGCNNETGEVVRLDLRTNIQLSLRGKISSSLLELNNLNYLDLSNIDFNESRIPMFIGSLTTLRYLSISYANLGWDIPHQLGNLSALESLNLAHNTHLDGGDLRWLSYLSSLKYLDLSGVFLRDANDWLHVVAKLPNLANLTLSSCSLPLPHAHHFINVSTSLLSLNVSNNYLHSMDWLFNFISTNLVSLDLSYNSLQSSIPDVFGDLTSLAYLDLSHNLLNGSLPNAFGNLISLAHLHLRSNYLEGPIPDSFGNMISLVRLNLRSNHLQGHIPDTFGKMVSLSRLDLSKNQLEGSIPDAFRNLISLAHLDLSSNQLEGAIPDAFKHMISLTHLDLSDNQLQSGIPIFFGNLCTLRRLHLNANHLGGDLGFIQNLSGCKRNFLEFLDLGDNEITGSLPDLTMFSRLRELRLVRNRFSGSIPESIGQLPMLEVLDVSFNSFEGVISEAHLSNLSKLKHLDLAFNTLALSFRSDWVPPFQLELISLASCKLGPDFPKWILTQNKFTRLDISSAEISDRVPSSLWDLSPDLLYLNLSHNHINGPIENISSNFGYTDLVEIDLSSNHFEGPISPFLLQTMLLNLSKNKFSGFISFLCETSNQLLRVLDLSKNMLSGELPDCWTNITQLVVLNLGSNNFYGKIPNSMGFLSSLETLQLRNNHLTGEIPLTFKNCFQLTSIDLGENKLSGTLPGLIGESLSNLIVLILRSNQFHGSMPLSFCHLAYIQILDLSSNNITDIIPKCLNNFTAMAQKGNVSATISHEYHSFSRSPVVNRGRYNDIVSLGWKGGVFEFGNTLGLVKSIDLSSNKITGEMPKEITDLVGLVSLNLSRNNLTGQIPSSIGLLTSLDFLDLSGNQINGGIPSSLAQLDRLSVLDLSNNKLSGKIPTGTQLQSFNASTYAGNPGLCGSPLNECPRPREEPAVDQEGNDGFMTREFYISLVLGFAVGFWVVYGTLQLKRPWRYAYFQFLNKTKDWLYVKTAVNIAKLKRRLQS